MKKLIRGNKRHFQPLASPYPTPGMKHLLWSERCPPNPPGLQRSEKEGSEGDGNAVPPTSLYPNLQNPNQIDIFRLCAQKPPSRVNQTHLTGRNLELAVVRRTGGFRPVLVTFRGLTYALQAHDLKCVGLASLLIIAACKKLLRIPGVFFFLGQENKINI